MNYQKYFNTSLNEIELGNFESGFWKVEDFEVVDNTLQRKQPLVEIPIVKPEPTELNLSEIDCIFISYDEPNAEKNWADLLTKAPWAKRIHGIKGSDAAHKAAAELSTTDRFITVDADNIVDPKFFNIVLDYKKNPNLKYKQLSWCGKNIINGLVYGNGGLKCWSKHYVNNMRTHESAESDEAQVDFCWDDGYLQMANLHSISYNNASPLQAFRAGFREGVKMTLINGVRKEIYDLKKQIARRNYQRLLVWMNVGSDVDQGLWAMYGARLGCYMTNCTDWDYTQVRDFDYLNGLFESIAYNDPLEQIQMLGEILKLQLNLPVAFLNPDQSRFFKEVWSNPPRFDHMVAELDIDWDLLEL